MMIGALKPPLRSERTTSRPSVSGRPTSISTRSGELALAALAPLAPVSTAEASNSSCRDNCSTSVSRRSVSSSTIRILRSLAIGTILLRQAALGDPGSPGGRRPPPGLADGRRLDRTGGTWPRRHLGQQARGRRRHPAGGFPPAAIMVARRPPRPAANLPADPPDPARRRLVRGPERPPLQPADATHPRSGRGPPRPRGSPLRLHCRDRSQQRPAYRRPR